MKLTYLTACAIAALALGSIADEASATWYGAPQWAFNGGMMVWSRDPPGLAVREDVQYGAGLPNNWNGASVNLNVGTFGTRHRVQTHCSNNGYYFSGVSNGTTIYSNVYFDCPGLIMAWWGQGQLDQ